MKLSTRGRYGLKTMVDLAVAHGSGPVTVSALAKMQGISESYLEQLIAALKKDRLVVSVRGAQGGYMLAREPEKIKVKEVLMALEGTTSLVECVEDKPIDCQNVSCCSARPLWLKLQSKIDAVLNETTIQDMADDYTMQMRRTRQ